MSSTWFRNALLGSWPDLCTRLMAELPVDTYQVAVALHPNIWHGHSPWQVRTWFAECLRSGMVLLPEIDGWRTGLVAADVIVGDHGSVTAYGAALGLPTLLATFAEEDIDPESPVAALAATAPELDRGRPLRPQIEAAIRDHDPRTHEQLSASITSAPGEALDRLRALFYRLLDLDAPPADPPLAVLPEFTAPGAPALALRVSATVDGAAHRIRLTRRPAVASWDAAADDYIAPHLLCPIDHPQRTLRAGATVLTAVGEPSLPDDWAENILRRHPGAAIVAVLGHHEATAEFRDGAVWRLSGRDVPADALPSALCAWHLAGLPARDLAPGFTLDLGDATYQISIRRGTAR